MNWDKEKNYIVRLGISAGLTDTEMDDTLVYFEAYYNWYIHYEKPLPAEIPVPVYRDNKLFRIVKYPRRLYKQLLGLDTFFEPAPLS